MRGIGDRPIIIGFNSKPEDFGCVNKCSCFNRFACNYCPIGTPTSDYEPGEGFKEFRKREKVSDDAYYSMRVNIDAESSAICEVFRIWPLKTAVCDSLELIAMDAYGAGMLDGMRRAKRNYDNSMQFELSNEKDEEFEKFKNDVCDALTRELDRDG